MAIDPHAPPALETVGAVSAIENELPTYRAISPLAVVSLILGGLAVFSFVHPAFYLASFGAAVTGLLALRSIRRLSDVLTGAEFARIGIFLGVALGLSALTVGLVRGILLDREAARFAREYAEAINSGRLEDALWYKMHPSERKGMTPADALTRFSGSDPGQKQMFEMENSQLMSFVARLTGGRTAHLAAIEKAGVDGINPTAVALLRVEGPGATADEYAAAELKGDGRNRRPEWWVDKVHYPYKPNSHVEEIKPVDDGHGHGSGGH